MNITLYNAVKYKSNYLLFDAINVHNHLSVCNMRLSCVKTDFSCCKYLFS
jgi:hypothetical protein